MAPAYFVDQGFKPNVGSVLWLILQRIWYKAVSKMYNMNMMQLKNDTSCDIQRLKKIYVTFYLEEQPIKKNKCFTLTTLG